MIHVVIPAAGIGRRFVEAGYPPKPHVLVDGVPMLRRVVDNVRPSVPHEVTVVVTDTPPFLGHGIHIVQLPEPTSGAVETILRAGVGDGPLLVANCDQLLGYNVDDLIGSEADTDGVIATFTASSPAHSYVRGDQMRGWVTEIVEKQVISDEAVAGVYYFPFGAMFREAAEAVLKDERRVLGEYYVSTVLDEMIRRGAKLTTHRGPVWTLGTPEELEAYHGRQP